MLRYFLFTIFILSASPSWAWWFGNSEEEVIQTTYHIIQPGENFFGIAQSFDLGFDEILRANPHITNPHLIYAGDKIILPIVHLTPDIKEEEGIIINIAELRLFFYPMAKS